jgi:hypothetical protein
MPITVFPDVVFRHAVISAGVRGGRSARTSA